MHFHALSVEYVCLAKTEKAQRYTFRQLDLSLHFCFNFAFVSDLQCISRETLCDRLFASCKKKAIDHLKDSRSLSIVTY